MQRLHAAGLEKGLSAMKSYPPEAHAATTEWLDNLTDDQVRAYVTDLARKDTAVADVVQAKQLTAHQMRTFFQQRIVGSFFQSDVKHDIQELQYRI